MDRQKQTGKLIARIAENLPLMEGDIMQDWINNPKGLQEFLKGLCPLEVTTSKEKAPLDFIIRVDRSVKPIYPEWMEKLMHPELELSGPAEYDLSQVDQWLHDDQKCGSVIGYTICKHLQKGNNLATCLNLQDGRAIQQKGIAVFRQLFAGKAVFLWGSVVHGRGIVDVPYLVEIDGRVVVRWYSLDDFLNPGNPALRFKR